MTNYFNINGYFKNDKEEFEDYIVKDTNDVNEDDEDIFFYGLSEEDIKDDINKETAQDFVITSYKKIKDFTIKQEEGNNV